LADWTCTVPSTSVTPLYVSLKVTVPPAKDASPDFTVAVNFTTLPLAVLVGLTASVVVVVAA
jgi:hypothetical protein